LSEHAAHIEEREILHQIARLSSQGWTATELLQRASA